MPQRRPKSPPPPADELDAAIALYGAPHGTYCEFVSQLGIRLSDNQFDICSVLFDGAEPEGSAFFGGAEFILAMARRIVVAVCGARGGKTYLFIAIRLLWGAITRDLSELPPGQEACALIVSERLKLAREALRYIAGAIREESFLRAMLVSESVDRLVIRRPDGKHVAFECLPASAGGAATRGRWFTDAALDEFAFFRSDDYKVNDKEILRAVRPRVLPGGQVLLVSTPYLQDGELYRLFSENFGKASEALAVRATTLELWDRPALRQEVDAEYRKDPENAEREYGAKFVAVGSKQYFEPGALDPCIDPVLPEVRVPEPGERTAAGGDFAFRRDSAALVIVHIGQEAANDTGTVRPVLRVGEIRELRPDGEPLKPSAVVAEFARIIHAHHGTGVMADGHYRESVVEHLDEHDLSYMEAPSTPADAYVYARQLMRERKVRIPNHPKLLRQLREVRGEDLPGGGTRILQRRTPGGHGDLASAFVLALYQHRGGELVPGPPPDKDDAMREARRLAQLAKARDTTRHGWLHRKRR